jgi:hypothetical protein
MTRPIFSLDQARALLPQVKLLTADAVIRAEAVSAELQRLSEADPAHEPLTRTLREIVDTWAEAVGELGPEAKGLWLVDFDNGEGYYCWKYPEAGIVHYHGYEDGFAGRIPIQ